MTEEMLNKSYELNTKIKNYKKFLEAFYSPYINVIRANDYKDDRDISQILYISSEPELESFIREYIINKIIDMEEEFENIK